MFLVLARNLATSGTQTPIYEHYFAGGFTSLRGYDFRGASPVDGIVRVGGNSSGSTPPSIYSRSQPTI